MHYVNVTQKKKNEEEGKEKHVQMHVLIKPFIELNSLLAVHSSVQCILFAAAVVEHN